MGFDIIIIDYLGLLLELIAFIPFELGIATEILISREIKKIKTRQ